MKLWHHFRSLWPRWTLLPVAPFALWTCFWLARGKVRWDHIAVTLLAGGLAYGSAKTKRLYLCLVPVALVAILYDAMRFVQNVGLSVTSIHDCDLRELEVTLFGYVSNGQRFTLHDFAQSHATMALDVFFAIPYGIFIYTVMGFAVYLVARHLPSANRFTWGFFLLNLLGFATYHVFPAAPPWYYHAYGCTIDLAAKASPGPNLLRVDALLGLEYFTGFYGRSSDVFGAVPSLHVAYPLLMCIEGWPLHRWLVRGLLGAFYLWMCAAAVYLDHHWVIDIVLGTLYAVIVAVSMRRIVTLGGGTLRRAIDRLPVAREGRS
jgi:inositol phosphorylceramide synthase catalytic subunit